MILNVLLFVVGCFSLYMLYREVTTTPDIPVSPWRIWYLPKGGHIDYNYWTGEITTEGASPADKEGWECIDRWHGRYKKTTHLCPLEFTVGDDWSWATYFLNEDGDVQLKETGSDW